MEISQNFVVFSEYMNFTSLGPDFNLFQDRIRAAAMNFVKETLVGLPPTPTEAGNLESVRK